MIILYAFCGALLLLAAVVLLKALLYKPEKDVSVEPSNVDFDKESASCTLSELIKCKTVSYRDKTLEDNAPFEEFKELLKRLFPITFDACEYKEIGDRAILLKLSGKKSDLAKVLMAHYDVVPADADGWKYPPYSGAIEQGCVWGRGALDTKVTVNAILQALENLLAKGYKPERDLYIAFGGDEEINGHGASDVVDYFSREGIKVEYVLDEGGAVVSGVFPGVSEKCALIGTAEKGIMNIRLVAKSEGGHASSPPAKTPIGRLAAACVAIEKSPFDFTISKPAADLFNTLAPRSSFFYRLVFANLWLFSPFLSRAFAKTGGEINALCRTTCALTQASGSDGANVLPTSASVVINIRINVGENVNSVVERLKSVINDPQVKIEVIYCSDPTPISDTDNESFTNLKKAIRATWPDALVSPYLMVACSDSRHWCRICDRVYRFSPVEMVDDIRGTIHGNNERIPLEVLNKSVEFYINLIREC